MTTTAISIALVRWQDHLRRIDPLQDTMKGLPRGAMPIQRKDLQSMKKKKQPTHAKKAVRR